VNKTLRPLILVLLSLPAAADTITGQVVDSNGNGVVGVDIDAKNLGGGGDPTLFNDGTDLNGFFTTTIPAGVYRITFIPPPPPTTTHLVFEIEPVVVVGTTNMGTISLPPGVSLAGHVEETNGFPVGGANIDVIDETAGDALVLTNDFTDAFGNFIVAVPAGPIELRIDATPVFSAILASTAIQLSPSGNTTLPTITLEPGFVLTGTVEDPNGDPVEDADLDVFDSAHEKLFTPGDSTDCSGEFSLVVPSGLFDLEVCPDPGDLLVATGVFGIAVSSDLDLGLFQLAPGAVLSGTVRNASGQPVAGVDIDVERSATLAEVVVCSDSTDAAGQYAVIVPFTTIDVMFTPDFSQALGSASVKNVLITGARTLNATLPNCPFATNYGAGLAGTGGTVPHITTSGGAPSVANPDWRIEMQNGRGGAFAILILSTGSAALPFRGGTILVNISVGQHFNQFVTLSGTPGAAGAGSYTFDPGPLTGASGFTGFAQFAVQDPGAVQGWAMSEGLQMTFCN